MKTTIARIFLNVGAGSFLLAVGFCWGNYHGGESATHTSNAATLVWLTGIDMALAKGDVADARQKTDDAIDGHVAVLSTMGKNHYLNFLIFNSPWMAANASSLNDHILRNTEKYFARVPNRLRPETKEYLSRYGNNHQ